MPLGGGEAEVSSLVAAKALRQTRVDFRARSHDVGLEDRDLRLLGPLVRLSTSGLTTTIVLRRRHGLPYRLSAAHDMFAILTSRLCQ